MNSIKYSMTFIVAAVFILMTLVGCSGNSTVESSAVQNNVSVSTRISEVSKEDKNGFNKHKNSTETVGGYVFSIPEYWKADIVESNHYRAYAETSKKVAMLQITSKHDTTDPVTFEILERENNSGAMAKAIATWFDSCGEIESELYDNGNVKGYVYSCDFTQDGYDGYTQTLTFPSPDENCWIYVTLIETNNTKYSYFADFSKILESILDAQSARIAAISKYPKTATYIFKDRRDRLYLTIDFEKKYFSSYSSLAGHQTSTNYMDFDGEYPNCFVGNKTRSNGDTVKRIVEFTGPENDPCLSIEETVINDNGYTYIRQYKRQSVEWIS